MDLWLSVGIHELAGNAILGLGRSRHVGSVLQVITVGIKEGWLLSFLLFRGRLRPRSGLDLAGVEELGLSSMLLPPGTVRLMMWSVEGNSGFSGRVVGPGRGAYVASHGLLISQIEPIGAWCAGGSGIGTVDTILSRARARCHVGGQRRRH